MFCSVKLSPEPLLYLLFLELNFVLVGPSLISEDAKSIPVGTKINFSSYYSPRILFRSFELI